MAVFMLMRTALMTMMAMMVMIVMTVMTMLMMMLVLTATFIVMTQLLLQLHLCAHLLMLFVIVPMRAASVTSVTVLVQNGHDAKVAAQPKDRRPEHKHRFLYNISIDDPFSCLEEQLSSDKPDDGYVSQCSERLQFLIAKGEQPRTLPVAHEDN